MAKRTDVETQIALLTNVLSHLWAAVDALTVHAEVNASLWTSAVERARDELTVADASLRVLTAPRERAKKGGRRG
jgi:hypothetical protein